MTTKERLHRLVDGLSELEAEDALRVIAARRGDAATMERRRIVLDDEQAARFLDALDAPGRFEPGLRRLVDRAATLDA
ncbi:MAG: DUF1778 domain-containing protein [Solirubrobacteraceae bacterium]|nr:DUF1778 domain-containing protein [Solirubrobacteraceae bacterium]